MVGAAGTLSVIMGYLDDAIREHLELKRRRGAPADELEREESEALGPIGGDDLHGEAPDEPAGEADDESSGPLAAQQFAEPVADHVEPVAEPATAVQPEPTLAEQLDEDDAVDQPTQSYAIEEIEDALAPEGAREHAQRPRAEAGDPTATDDDVLEATPDFLQETPEHERLWFEQKPPKDFDF